MRILALAGLVATSLALVAPAGAMPNTVSACGEVPSGYQLIESDELVIRGTEGNDFICAGGSNNRIFGLGGRDIIYAGDGRDRVDGGRGADRIYGGQGRDVLKGGAGADIVDGGPGRDRLSGNNGDDHLHGRGGADALSGGPGTDTLIGGRRVNTCKSGENNWNCTPVGAVYLREDVSNGVVISADNKRILFLGGDLVNGLTGETIHAPGEDEFLLAMSGDGHFAVLGKYREVNDVTESSFSILNNETGAEHDSTGWMTADVLRSFHMTNDGRKLFFIRGQRVGSPPLGVLPNFDFEAIMMDLETDEEVTFATGENTSLPSLDIADDGERVLLVDDIGYTISIFDENLSQTGVVNDRRLIDVSADATQVFVSTRSAFVDYSTASIDTTTLVETAIPVPEFPDYKVFYDSWSGDGTVAVAGLIGDTRKLENTSGYTIVDVATNDLLATYRWSGPGGVYPDQVSPDGDSLAVLSQADLSSGETLRFLAYYLVPTLPG